MLPNILGTHLELPVRLAIATVVIVALLALTALLVRYLSGPARTPGGRSRQGRLAVMDTVPVDQKRRLVLVRRDDVEHLLLIGGSRDLVVEPGITREPGQLRESSAERPALNTRETPLLRRTAAPAAPALMPAPQASAPPLVAPTEAAADAEPPGSPSPSLPPRSAASAPSRPESDATGLPPRPVREDKEETDASAPPQAAAPSPRPMFESRIKRPKLEPSLQSVRPKIPSVKPATQTPPPIEAASEAPTTGAAGTLSSVEVPASTVTPADEGIQAPATQMASDMGGVETENVAAKRVEMSGDTESAQDAPVPMDAPAPMSAAAPDPAPIRDPHPIDAANTPEEALSPPKIPVVHAGEPGAAEPVRLPDPAGDPAPDPLAVAVPVPVSQDVPPPDMPPAPPDEKPDVHQRAGEPFITSTPWPRDSAAQDPALPPFQAPPAPKAPIPQISEEDMAPRPPAGRRPAVFNFARPQRDAQPDGRDPRLEDLTDRLRGSLEKSLKPEPVEPRPNVEPQEAVAPARSVQTEHKGQPDPIPSSGAIRPTGLFRATPVPDPVTQDTLHPLPATDGRESQDGLTRDHSPVRVVEPEQPPTTATLDFEADFMRELELTLSGETDMARPVLGASHTPDTPPAASEAKTSPRAPAADAPVPPSEADPFDDLEAEMASLLGRIPNTKPRQ